jgi:tetratricopeptide (TPR) repeat protein
MPIKALVVSLFRGIIHCKYADPATQYGTSSDGKKEFVMIKVSQYMGGLRKHPVWLVLFAFTLLLITVGCSGNVFEGVSDDDSDDAKLEEARMALDDANYSRAVELLNNLLDSNPTDPQALAYLSHAYAGLAGLDTLDLLTIIDELDENGQSGNIDMVGLVLGDEEGDVTAAEVAAKLNYLNDAIDSLEQIEANNGTLSDDETVQRGVLAVARTTMVIADIIFSDQGAGGDDTIRLTEDGLDELYSGTPDFDGDVDAAQSGYLADDIVAIQDSVVVLEEIGSDNDLSEDFDEFEQDINPDGNTIISVEELETYVGSL